MNNRGWSMVGGIIDLLIGILLMTLPLTSMLFLALYVGFGILFRSVMAIGKAIDLKTQKTGDWGYLLFIGGLPLFSIRESGLLWQVFSKFIFHSD